MTWVLHLSALHLGASGDVDLEDAKLDIEPTDKKLTAHKVLKRTLGTVQDLVEKHGKPTVAAISGDLTTAAGLDGFEAFAALLTDFAHVLPDAPERIVVVPGNHDVDWGQEPGTGERYAGFHSVTRDRGLTTPLIDDIDFQESDAGIKLRDGALDRPPLVVTDDLVVAAINSSNWCGVVAPDPRRRSDDDWAQALSPLDASARAEALDELRRMRQYDIGRVSRPQFDAIRKALDESGVPRAASDDRGRVRIAVIHHQLLPVSPAEEVKAFESVINLGFVRDALRDLGFHVVLHGHKHESGLQWDVGRLADEPLEAPERRMLLVASPGRFERGGPAMRALELVGDRAARSLRVSTLLGVDTERKTPKLDTTDVPLWRAEMALDAVAAELIHGPDSHTVYSRLKSSFEAKTTPAMHQLVCVLESSEGATTLPASYPEMESGTDGQQWFDELVAWWQHEDPALVRDGTLPFNHGERIYTRFDDQLERAANLLSSKRDTTRGIIQLFSPTEDRNPPGDFEHGLIPAFSFVQPVLRKMNGGDYRLDCIGYFRKQEMRFWWPINVAELAVVQERLLARLSSDGLGVTAGRLVTVSAVAHYGSRLPRMAVPEIDLAVEDANRLWRMAAAVCFPDGAGARDGFADWRRMLEDLRGRLEDGSLRAAHAGPARLLDHLRTLQSFEAGDATGAAESALDDLVEMYEAHPERIRGPQKTAKAVARIDKLDRAIADLEPE